jgi:hypothetical protein
MLLNVGMKETYPNPCHPPPVSSCGQVQISTMSHLLSPRKIACLGGVTEVRPDEGWGRNPDLSPGGASGMPGG